MIREDESATTISSGGVVGGVPGGVPGGQMNGVIGGIISATSNMVAIPKLAPVTAKRVRISQGVIAGMVIYRVEPRISIVGTAGTHSGRSRDELPSSPKKGRLKTCKW